MFRHSPSGSTLPNHFDFDSLYFYFLHAYEKLGFIEFSKMLLAYFAIGLFCFAVLWCIPLTRNIIIMTFNVISFVYYILDLLFCGVILVIRGLIFSGESIVRGCRIIASRKRVNDESKNNEEGRGHSDQFKEDEYFKKGFYSSCDGDEERCFKVLGIKEKPTSESLKKAFKATMLKYHPDRVQSLGVEFQEMAKEKSIVINEAYSFLKNKYGIN